MALTQIGPGGIKDDAVTADMIPANAVGTSEIAADAVTAAQIADDVINSEHIAAGAVDLEHMSSESVDEDNLHISNAGSNGQFLSKQSGNTGGLTWATPQDTLSHRNIIVNGGCLVAQRGTSSTSTGYGSVDRMEMVTANTDNLAFLQKQTDDYPDGFSKCWEFDVTTTETTLDADEIVYMRYKVEAQDLRPFYNANGSGKNFTLSFWVKAKQTGTYQVSIHKADNTTRFISTTYTIAAADTWQKVVWNVTGDTGTSGINADNGQGFQIAWQLAAGTNYTSGGVQSSWGSFSNSVMAGGHAVNVADNTANYWRITGIQLEVGGTATDFEHRRYGDELARCQRYYFYTNQDAQSHYNHAVGGAYNSTSTQVTTKLPVTMRDVPTLSAAGNLRIWSLGSGNAPAVTGISLEATNSDANQVTMTVSASGGGLTTSSPVHIQSDNATGAQLQFSAEL